MVGTVGPTAGIAWRREPSPPVYWGAGSLSGSVTVVAHPRPSGGYLLFVTDQDTVQVSAGSPTRDGWHRLDGPDASALCATGASDPSCNHDSTYPRDTAGVKLHFDPHPVAVSATFDLTLRAPATSVPPAYRHNTELASCAGGAIFYGNDGGLSHSSDCGSHFQQAENLNTLIAGELAGVSRPTGMPALYFGGPDNDPFFSPDGGANWRVASDWCGDCQGFYTDARQTGYVVHQIRGQQLWVYKSNGPGLVPDATDQSAASSIDLPVGATEMINASPGPVIQSLATEAPPTLPDLIWPATNAAGVTTLWRHQNRAQSAWSQQGPDLPTGLTGAVAQSSGGHATPTFYVADRTGADPSDQPNRLWRSHRIGNGAILGWDCIVPGPATPGQSDGRCTFSPRATATDGTTVCAPGRACRAWNFAADPYDPQVVYVSDDDGIKMSTDGGQTWRLDSTLDNWLTAGHTIGPDCRFMCNYTDTILRFSGITFVPDEPQVRFAVGEAGVFMTTNAISGGAAGTASETWHRLWDSGSMACEPGIPFFTAHTTLGRSLYVPCHGRSLLSFHGIPTAMGLSAQLDRTMVVGGAAGAMTNNPGNGMLLPPTAPAPNVPQPTSLVRPPEEDEKDEKDDKPESIPTVSVKGHVVRGNYSGPCPPPPGKAPAFTAVISVSDGPVTVTYQWLTSNGGSSDPQTKTIDFPKTGPQQATVTFTETSYLPGQTVKNWIAVYVRTPAEAESNHMDFTNTCS